MPWTTVEGTTTQVPLRTAGAEGLTFRAWIDSESGWCSFDIDRTVTERTGRVGEVIGLYFPPNDTSADRRAFVTIRFSDGYERTFDLLQEGSSVDRTYFRAWAEQPEYREGADYIYKTYYTTLHDRRVASRNYSICFDTSKRAPLWVAYPLHPVYFHPSVSRTNAFGYDPNRTAPEIPYQYQPDLAGGRGVRGFDRGHMCPSADRYSTTDTNRQTFYATNMTAQVSQFNQGVWASLENAVRQNAPTSNQMSSRDTLYVVIGALYENGARMQWYGRDVAVPSHLYKILLRTRNNTAGKPLSECSADELKCIAFLFSNSEAAGTIRGAVTTVAEVERRSGFTFFRNLRPDAAREVKQQHDPSDWIGL